MYPCKDGYVSVSVVTPAQTENLFLLMGMPELLEDPRFATDFGRWDRADELDEVVVPWMMEHTMEEIVTLSQELRIPCTRVPTFGQLLDDHQLGARDYWVAMEHPFAGRQTYAGAPFKMSETPWQVTRAPLLGENNEEIYGGELGCSKEDLVRLRERNII